MYRSQLVVSVLVMLLTLTGCSSYRPGDNHAVASFRSVASVGQDGDVTVTETIEYAYGTDTSTGFERSIPIHLTVGGVKRTTQIDNVQVSSPTGAPVDVNQDIETDRLTIRIGGAGAEVTGQHVYEIQYRMRAVTGRSDGQDLVSLDLLSPFWKVPVRKVQIDFRTPVDPTSSSCQLPSRPCVTQTQDTGVPGVMINSDTVAAGEGLTVNAELPLNTFSSVSPLQDPYSAIPGLGWSAADIVLTVLALVVLAIAGAARVLRSWRDGLDSVSDTAPSDSLYPPDGAAPAELAALVRGEVDNHATMGAIMNLGARGNLTIREMPDDWAINITKRTVVGIPAHEQQLLDSIRQKIQSHGDHNGSIGLREIYGTESSVLDPLSEAVDLELVERGWINNGPPPLRRSTEVAGAVLIVVGLGLAISLSLTVGHGLIGLGLAAGGLAWIGLARLIPRRTTTGNQAYARTVEFSDALEAAPITQNAIDVLLPYSQALMVDSSWDDAIMSRPLAPPPWYQPSARKKLDSPASWWPGLAALWTYGGVPDWTSRITDWMREDPAAITSSPRDYVPSTNASDVAEAPEVSTLIGDETTAPVSPPAAAVDLTRTTDNNGSRPLTPLDADYPIEDLSPLHDDPTDTKKSSDSSLSPIIGDELVSSPDDEIFAEVDKHNDATEPEQKIEEDTTVSPPSPQQELEPADTESSIEDLSNDQLLARLDQLAEFNDSIQTPEPATPNNVVQPTPDIERSVGAHNIPVSAQSVERSRWLLSKVNDERQRVAQIHVSSRKTT